MIRQQHIQRLLPIVIIALLSGCAVKFFYNQLDWLIPWYLDDYVTLDYNQQELLEERLQDYLSWHRKDQLPVYADFLEWIADASVDGLDQQEVNVIVVRVEAFTNLLSARLAPSLTDLFANVNDDQVEQMFNNFEQENRKYIKRYVDTPEKRQREKRGHEIKRYIERWTSELNEQQIDMIEQWSGQYRHMGREFVDSRVVWQARLRQILEQRNDRISLASSLSELFANRRLARSQQYRQKYQFNEALLKSLYLKLDRSLSSYQRAHMIRTLHAYARDFRELSKQSVK